MHIQSHKKLVIRNESLFVLIDIWLIGKSLLLACD